METYITLTMALLALILGYILRSRCTHIVTPCCTCDREIDGGVAREPGEQNGMGN
jgi:hypothetical protein